jgi:branched-chain amino acid transport system ATP-binding protein
MQETLLAAEDIAASFGGVAALDGASVHVRRGEVCGLIGPNGAGKSTLLNCVSGFVRPGRGRIAIGGRDSTSLRPHAVARLGVARTFQHLSLIPRCTVRENVRLGCHRRSRREAAEAARSAESLIERLDLTAVAEALPGELDQGARRRVEVARALVGSPPLVLLDEPLSGLGEADASDLIGLLARERAETGASYLIVEHNLGLLRSVVDRLVVLDFGRTLAEGEPERVLEDPAVVAAYLGGDL